MSVSIERPPSSREALPSVSPACASCPYARPAFDPGVRPADYLVAVAGNPNTGKSTVFNAITGLRHGRTVHQ